MFPQPLLLVVIIIVLLLGLAILFFIVRPIFVTIEVRKHGKTIEATVTKVDAELVLSTRGHTTSYFVHADWEDPCTHKVYHFKSPAGGVRVSLNHPPGSLIEVRINTKNPRRYEVVLGFDERSYV
jgi:Protein of unknown function (DUF3592)